MTDQEADVVIVGSGISGVLVARELLASGSSVLILERGERVSWAQQRRARRWEGDGSTVEHNHDADPDGLDWPWQYVYGLGGTLNRWGATSPRLLPEDFEMRSRYGVMRDWPFGYDVLLPHYQAAERALAIAGPRSALMPGAGFPQPPHPPSQVDRLVRDHLGPFIPLPQARPTRPVGDSPACCGSFSCQLCPVNAKATVLNRLGDVLAAPGLRILDRTVAARLETDPSGRRIAAISCVSSGGDPFRVRGRRFVLAANGIESAGMLLRSGLTGGDTGHFLFDHRNAQILVTTRRETAPGRGASLITGASYAYYPGAHRARRAGVLLLPYNPGPPNTPIFESLVAGMVAGRSGRRLREDATREWKRTVALDVFVDDLPDAGNMVRLGTKRDAFGLPRNLVTFRPPSDYFKRGVAHVLEDLPRRLAPLGAGEARFAYTTAGGHLLGTARTGDGDNGVVDADLRHRRRENLWVTGGAVFPTYSPSHPTLTIAALAVRLGRLLARGA